MPALQRANIQILFSIRLPQTNNCNRCAAKLIESRRNRSCFFLIQFLPRFGFLLCGAWHPLRAIHLAVHLALKGGRKTRQKKDVHPTETMRSPLCAKSLAKSERAIILHQSVSIRPPSAAAVHYSLAARCNGKRDRRSPIRIS